MSEPNNDVRETCIYPPCSNPRKLRRGAQFCAYCSASVPEIRLMRATIVRQRDRIKDLEGDVAFLERRALRSILERSSDAIRDLAGSISIARTKR